MSDDIDGTWAAPTAPPESSAVVPPFLLRGVARAIDVAVQLLVLDAAFRVSAVLPEWSLFQVGEDALFYVDVTVGLTAFVAYSAASEWLGAATFGKFCTGLRVGQAGDTRQRVSARAALIRSLAFLIDSLFFGLVAYSAVMRSQVGQRLGDEWAGTRVVWRGEGPEVAGWRGWPVGFGVALAWVVGSYLVAS